MSVHVSTVSSETKTGRSRSRKKQTQKETQAETPVVAEQTPQVEQPPAEESKTVTVQLEGARLVQTVVGKLPGATGEKWLDASKLLSFDLQTGRVTMSAEQAAKWKLVAA